MKMECWIIGVINGASNLTKFVESGEMNKYHFVEVMACPGGCVNGGGQPHIDAKEMEKINIKEVRASVLYNQDVHAEKRKSYKNEALMKMYNEYMGTPGGHKAHELLHLKYTK